MVQLGVTFLYLILAVIFVNAKCQYDYEALEGKYSYHVSIRYKGEHKCSGSIINERYILTSANCVVSLPAEHLVIVTGTKYLQASGDSYEIEKIIINCDKYGDGIALLRTYNNINFNENVQSIEVANHNMDSTGYPVILTAWKKPHCGEHMTHKLQVFNYRSYSLSDCKKKYNHTTDMSLCITKSGSERICDMDYGGAIVTNNRIIGIKLSGDDCVTNCPEVHLGVFKYFYWIRDNSELSPNSDYVTWALPMPDGKTNQAPKDKYGYHVSIRYKGEHKCSGSIINKRHILTSANCIASLPAEHLVIVTGTKLLQAREDSYDIQKIIINCDKNGDGIALLRTYNNINFNENVQSIEVADYNTDLPGYPVILTAWTESHSGEHMTHKLQIFNYKIDSLTECKKKYNHTTDASLCITKSGSGRICNMDYGGAIVTNNRIIGIKLSGDDCVTNYPEVHLRLFKYFYWIRDNSDLSPNSDYITSTIPKSTGKSNYQAPEGKYPYHVSIKYDGEHMCSGSIINSRHILTSRLCIVSFSPENIRIVAGTNSRETGGHSYEVLKIIMPDNPQDDVAVVRTLKEINFNNEVNLIPIENCDCQRNGESIFLTAWERPLSGKPITDKLHVYNYKIYNQYECMKKYSYVTEKDICIIKSDGESICDMDMGGAIVSGNRLIGIKSYGKVCVGNEPEVNFGISHSLNWIIKNSDLSQIM